MDFDFNLILVPATLFFIAVWLLDKFVFKQRQTKGKGNENVIITWAYDFWPVLTVVLVLRSFLYEPFNIPSDSMVPTLETGDFILVNKFEYGVKLPILNTKIIDTGRPDRGGCGGTAAMRKFPQYNIPAAGTACYTDHQRKRHRCNRGNRVGRQRHAGGHRGFGDPGRPARADE